MKKITAKEFRELGLLQEVNRLLLHPMGLALEVVIDDEGNETFGQVWDCRDHEKGITFAQDSISADKVKTVTKLFEDKMFHREMKLGWHVQPSDSYPQIKTTVQREVQCLDTP